MVSGWEGNRQCSANLRHSSEMSNLELKKRLRLGCLVILVVGLCSSALIYAFAEDVVDDSLGYMVVNGIAYPLSARDFKPYRRELERFGGKTLLMFDDFNHWFTDLWRGKTLAKTVAWISILVSLGIHLFASSFPDNVPDRQEGRERNKPD
jgi:hypothetical protein